MYALVDGNNFYASCERVFRPSLHGRPLIVLSNNDGCAIARSNEAKELGVKMGAPWFQIRHLGDSAGLVALSANFPLYGDMSDRMMSIAAGLGPTQEIYSIDESFIGLQGVRNVTRRAWAIRARILKWIGIPCGIGIGATKTLAKLANHIAKSAERKPGSYPAKLAQVCNLTELAPDELQRILLVTPVTDVWGVGRRIGASLMEQGVSNVEDLRRLDAAMVRMRWGVVLERTVRELQGQSCITLDDAPAPKQMIACTRSFGKTVTDLPPLLEAVSEFATRAAEKLRKQDGRAGQIQVFAHTSPHRPGPRFSRSIIVPLVRPTADTRQLVQAACRGIERIYVPGFDLIKAGVILMDLIGPEVQQCELGFDEPEARDHTRLMSALDAVNARFGKGSIHVAATGQERPAREWGMKQERRTPHYTTCIDDIPIARA
ncbi:Y-family DNA polymerase [Diaphorobacter caeni]|uniref:Y-family DNA polymerase n=1 Tax=Diaphorobacter caeni TaxID=2784387 RepID=UPI00188E40DE|nr:Y-family DNA polymerase [Diaphorobacter caeni]MBF5006821.1 Y-family DNA polymerase [Diaphorobacter caeni]